VSRNTHTQPFNGPLSWTTRVSRYQKKHSPFTPILIIRHPLSTFSIHYDTQHPPCSICMLDSPLPQRLSRSSFVFLLALDPVLHAAALATGWTGMVICSEKKMMTEWITYISIHFFTQLSSFRYRCPYQSSLLQEPQHEQLDDHKPCKRRRETQGCSWPLLGCKRTPSQICKSSNTAQLHTDTTDSQSLM